MLDAAAAIERPRDAPKVAAFLCNDEGGRLGLPHAKASLGKNLGEENANRSVGKEARPGRSGRENQDREQ